MKSLMGYRLCCAVVLGWLVALGLGSKAYTGWAQEWVNNSSGDVLYEMFWIWLVGSARVRWRVKDIAIATFLLTSLVEFSQLIPFPAAWQAQLWWRLLLGTHLTRADFVYYAVGCSLGGLSLSWLRRRFRLSQQAGRSTL